MSEFDDLWAAGLSAARTRTDARGDAVADRLERVSFPGAIAVLAGPGREGHVPFVDVLAGLAEHIAGSAEARKRGASTATITSALRGLFAAHDRPSTLPNGLPALVVRKALERQGLGVSDDELREIIGLLETGRFFGNLEESTTAVVDAVPEVPLALLADLMRSPELLERVARTAPGDALGLSERVAALAGHLLAKLRGETPPPPAIEPRVLGALYATHSAGTLRRLLARLLHHDNRTVRLALILYARSNGWAVSDTDIDVVYTNLIRRDQPNLGPVLERAIVVMANHYSPVELERGLAFLRPTA